MSPTAAQQSLSNFYESVKFSNPRTAALMHADILTVALFSLAKDKTPGVRAAYNLRVTAFDLPPVLQRVLEGALTDLGFPPGVEGSEGV